MRNVTEKKNSCTHSYVGKHQGGMRNVTEEKNSCTHSSVSSCCTVGIIKGDWWAHFVVCFLLFVFCCLFFECVYIYFFKCKPSCMILCVCVCWGVGWGCLLLLFWRKPNFMTGFFLVFFFLVKDKTKFSKTAYDCRWHWKMHTTSPFQWQEAVYVHKL